MSKPQLCEAEFEKDGVLWRIFPVKDGYLCEAGPEDCNQEDGTPTHAEWEAVYHDEDGSSIRMLCRKHMEEWSGVGGLKR